MSLAWALLIIRLAVGLVMIGHGTQKLFGWFGGRGWNAAVSMLRAKGFKAAALWALLGVAGEVGGGLSLALGFLTPLGAAGVFASMLMAIVKFHWKQGLWAAKGGYEYPLVLLAVSAAIGLVGPGAFALDTLFGFALPNAVIFLIGAAVAAAVDGIGVATSQAPAPAPQPAGHTA